MAQEKILGNQLNLTDVAQGLSGEGTLIADIVEDTTPQLGGDLDVNAFNIVTADPVVAQDTSINIYGGANSNVAAGYWSGSINILGGYGTNGNYSGYVTIYGGQCDNEIGGTVDVIGGAGTNGYEGGYVTIQGGSSDGGSGGYLYVEGGTGAGAAAGGGDVDIRGGYSNFVYGGDVSIEGGAAKTAAQQAGSIRLLRGKGHASALEGSIKFEAPRGEAGEGSVQFWHHTGVGHTTGNYVELKAPTNFLAGSPPSLTNLILTLPGIDGVNGDAMLTDGSGNLSIGTPRNVLNDWTTLSGSPPDVVVANDRIFAATDVDIVGITLPTGILGDTVEVVDAGNNAATNNITITPASGEKMEAVVDASYTISANLGTVNFVYSGTVSGWIAR